jgi:hypothetical protein
MKTRLTLFALFTGSMAMHATAASLGPATICAGAATLDNGSIVTIGQPFVGLMQAGDDSVSLNVGIIPVLEEGPVRIEPPQINPVMQLVGGRFQMSFASQPGCNYVVQASTNLTDWIPIWTNTALGSSLLFEDSDTANFDRRFYRVVAP